MRARARAIVAILFLLGSAGCSWLLGVSEDPVVTGDLLDAGDETDAELDAAEDVEPE